MFVMATLMTNTRSYAQTERALYNFNDIDSGADGISPMSKLIFDSLGNLYGTTSQGGAFGFGIVFELVPRGGGGWSETVLHNFQSSDGGSPANQGG